MTELRKIDATIISPLESNGAIPVNIQDQHTRTFDIYFSQEIGITSTLATAGVINEYTLDVNAGSGIVAGDQLVVFDSVSDRLYIGMVLSFVADLATLDTPLNFSFPTATTVLVRSTREMDVDGSVTRQTFAIEPPIDVEIDITRVMFQITTTDFPELDMFGDIVGGITRGLVFRVINGENVNYFNTKTNAELVNLMYDITFYEAAKHGVNGIGGRLTYGGQAKHGVTIRLSQGDRLEMIIQDNLASLLSFRVIAAGHLVTD